MANSFVTKEIPAFAGMTVGCVVASIRFRKQELRRIESELRDQARYHVVQQG